MKGAGRISRYRQTFVDTHAHVAIRKLYTEKTGDRRPRPVEPCRTTGSSPSLPRMASARRASRPTGAPNRHRYRGKVENHACRLYLAAEDEFHDIAFRKKLYRSVEESQTDLDVWQPDTTSGDRIPEETAMARHLCGPSVKRNTLPWTRP